MKKKSRIIYMGIVSVAFWAASLWSFIYPGTVLPMVYLEMNLILHLVLVGTAAFLTYCTFLLIFKKAFNNKNRVIYCAGILLATGCFWMFWNTKISFLILSASSMMRPFDKI